MSEEIIAFGKNNLVVDVTKTYRVNWFTDSYMYENGKMGLAEFASHVFNLPQREIDLLESPNESVYSITISKEDKIADFQRKKAEEIKNSGEIEGGFLYFGFNLRIILLLLYEMGAIPSGEYVIKMS